MPDRSKSTLPDARRTIIGTDRTINGTERTIIGTEVQTGGCDRGFSQILKIFGGFSELATPGLEPWSPAWQASASSLNHRGNLARPRTCRAHRCGRTNYCPGHN